MKCRALYPMHGVPGAKHCFLEAGNGSEISFVQFENAREGVSGEAFAPAANGFSPIGSHHHMAYRCETMEQLLEIREQVRPLAIS